MLIGIPKETAAHEKRVAATPETVKKLLKDGLQVVVQAGAGAESQIPDSEFSAAGASIEPDVRKLLAQADVLFKVQKPTPEETSLIKEGATLIAILQPLQHPEIVESLRARKASALSMDLVPRIARAQKLDALSSQANVAGYKAVLMAANTIGKMMPMLMTAAGTITPAKVFVIGAGVAGLQAIATAKRLGAVVEAYDTRPVVKEQVESLGGRFVQAEAAPAAEAEDKRGYAKEQTQEQKDKERALVAKHVAANDIVITTAAIPGRKSPVIVTADMVKAMRPGSVIVDIAADGGGNCELTEAGQEVVKHGVTIIGRLNVPSLMPHQSSQLYARNVYNLFGEIFKKGALEFDLNNEVVRDALATRGGEIVSPLLAGKK